MTSGHFDKCWMKADFDKAVTYVQITRGQIYNRVFSIDQIPQTLEDYRYEFLKLHRTEDYLRKNYADYADVNQILEENIAWIPRHICEISSLPEVNKLAKYDEMLSKIKEYEQEFFDKANDPESEYNIQRRKKLEEDKLWRQQHMPRISLLKFRKVYK